MSPAALPHSPARRRPASPSEGKGGRVHRVVHGLSIGAAALTTLLSWAPAHAGPAKPLATKTTKVPATELYPWEPRDEATFSAELRRSGSDALDTGDEIGTELASVTQLFGQTIVKNALPYLGSRYVWGGAGPSGFDCSGFIYWVLSEASHPISRDHYGQIGSGERVGRSELEPGDLVFFGGTYVGGLSHSGIYIGDGRFIHAASERTGVIISDLDDSYWLAHYYSATRVG